MKNIVTFKCDCGVITRMEFVNPPKVGQKIPCLSCNNVYMLEQVQPCGHPLSAIVTNGTTSYCGSCADDSLRANIAAGVEN